MFGGIRSRILNQFRLPAAFLYVTEVTILTEIKDIYINYRKDGFVVTDTDSPVFSWSLESTESENFQKSFSLRIYDEDNRLIAEKSGQTKTQSVKLDSEKERLPKGVLLTLTLRVTDRFGYETEEKRAEFIDGNVDRWPAKWISTPERINRKSFSFRKIFSIQKQIKSAVLYCCGIGYQRISLNGERLGNLLDPAHSNYAKVCYYTVDARLEKLLNIGENVINIDIADGWRFNDNETLRVVFGNSRIIEFFGQPMLTAFIDIRYADGTSEKICTDTDWEWREGAAVEASIFKGETYDASLSDSSWYTTGKADGNKPALSDGPGGEMRPMAISPVRAKKYYTPVDCFRTDSNTCIFDFGQNIAGIPVITLPKGLKKGDKIILTHGEMLGEDGKLYNLPLRDADQRDTYIASGKEEGCVWSPSFTYHGFRYIEVNSPVLFTADDIRAAAIYTDIDKPRNMFRCGSALVTKIHENCVMTERANIHSIFTDCPQRDERMGWMNDATVRFEETPYNFDIGTMFPKIIRDIHYEQREDGAFTCCAPFVYGAYPADPVCSSFLVAGNMALMHTGNRQIIEEMLDNYCAWEDSLLSRSEDYIVNYSYYGDWAGPAYACVSPENANSAQTPGIFMSTGFSYYNCVLIEKFAKLLDRADVARKYHDIGERIKHAMLDKWFDSGSAVMATGSQACQAFSLWLGILPEDKRVLAAEVLHNDLVSANYRFTTGNLCTKYMFEVLTEYGYIEDVWKILYSEKYPGYGYMIENEATTVWERFELKKEEGMNSHNHPMFASVDSWFYAYLCGIKPILPAFERFSVKPCYPEGLLFAHAVVETVRGNISVRWTKRFGTTNLFVTVPFGTEADIEVNGKIVSVSSGSYVYNW